MANIYKVVAQVGYNDNETTVNVYASDASKAAADAFRKLKKDNWKVEILKCEKTLKVDVHYKS